MADLWRGGELAGVVVGAGPVEEGFGAEPGEGYLAGPGVDLPGQQVGQVCGEDRAGETQG